ncbi:MAG TPA: hypothetical protein VIO94_02270, partial [Phenylobacterium sp.]
MAQDQRADSEDAPSRVGAARRAFVNRLVAAAAIGLAALPVLPISSVLLWLLVALTAATLEVLFDRGRQPLFAVLATLPYAAAAVLFWQAEENLARLFAIVIVMMTLLWLMMMHHARPRLFAAAAAPMLILTLAGAIDVIRLCVSRGEPWMAVTALMGPALITHYVLAARSRLLRAQSALGRAR